MIGSSDGKQYETGLGLAIGRPVEDPEKAAGASKSAMATPPKPANDNKPGTNRDGLIFDQLMKEFENLKSGGGQVVPFPKPESESIDRDHHVPLVASALTDDKGQMYGMAIDHRISPNPEYEKHLWNHEAYENDYMNDLVKNGMSSQDAYHKAHDWSTARESAAVTAEFGEKGLEDYKQHWRDAASIASEPTDRPRHPDAHTTKHGLDESETGKQFPPIREALFRGLRGAGINATDATFQPLNPMQPGYTNPGAHASAERPWFRGAEGKWRQEISDEGSKLKTGKLDTVLGKSASDDQFAVPENKSVKLEDIFHHPELYKSYPGLRDVKIEPVEDADLKKGIKGLTDKVGQTIALSPMTAESMHSTLLHEIQHLIQDREGFTGGSSPERMHPYMVEALIRANRENPNASLIPTKQEFLEARHTAYQNVAGEVEARNVQFRHKHPYAAKIFEPELTEDVPRSKQLNSPR
jgi:hypothetical protein